jgi:hypothetical protein
LKGDDLPVSAIPAMERIQTELQNGKNVIFVVAPIGMQTSVFSVVIVVLYGPHSVIRSKFYHKDLLTEVPEGSNLHQLMQEVSRKRSYSSGLRRRLYWL